MPYAASLANTEEEVTGGRVVEHYMERLGPMDRGTRALVVRNAPGLWCSAGVGAMVSRCRSAVYNSAQDAESWAELAVEAAERSEGVLRTDSVVEATAELANVLRIQGRLCAASVLLEECAARLADTTGAPRIAIRLGRYRCSLDLAAGRWESAAQRARAALSVATRAGDEGETFKCYLKLAHVYARTDRSEEALRTLGAIIPRVTGDEDPRLLFVLAHNILDAATEACPEQLCEWGERLWPLMQHAAPMHEAYRCWARAKALVAEGRLIEAEEALRFAAQSLERQESRWELGMVSLDLVEVLLRSPDGVVEADAVLCKLLSYYSRVPGASPELVTCLQNLYTALTSGLVTVAVVSGIRRHLARLWC